jgi:Hemolysin coregulated protein Hcp (TssD)
MAHTGEFQLDGKKAQIFALEYRFSRTPDAKGKPSTRVRSGEIELTIASEDALKSAVIEWLADTDAGKKGAIILYEGEGKNKREFKKIEFENGFVIKYAEKFTDNEFANVRETFTISAEKITIGAAKFDFTWPSTAS